MKIVFLKARAGFRGGLEKYTHHLTQAFAQHGHAVTLLTTGEAPQLDGIEVVSLAPDTSFTLHHIRRFDTLCKQWLEQHPAPIVFGMERTTAQTHYRAGNGVHKVFLERRRLIDSWWKQLTFRINPLHRSLLAMEKKAFESSTLQKLFTNSQMVKEEILTHYQTPQEKIEVVHNGVEWHFLSETFENTFQKPSDHVFQLLFIGNGYRRKGLSFLLKGLQKHRQKDFLLTVIGKDKNIPYFEQEAESLGIKEKVVFLGPQKDVFPFYQKADALVIPSIYDPFANVTVEALAMGLFVVSSQYNGGKEVLTSDSGVVIEDLASPESLAQALETAFQRPKTEISARMIRNSVKQLDFSNQLDRIVRSTIK